MSEIDKIDQAAAYAQDNAELRAELDAVKKATGAKRVELSRKLFGRFCEFQGDLSDLGNFCMWHCQRIDQSGNWRGGQGTGWYDSGVHPNGFKMQMSTGQITDYNFALYGLLA